jgi:hypothetical protein
MTSFKTKLENFVESFPVEPFLAIAFGAGIGLLAANTLQDYLSHLAVERCKVSTIHELVEINDPVIGILHPSDKALRSDNSSQALRSRFLHLEIHKFSLSPTLK